MKKIILAFSLAISFTSFSQKNDLIEKLSLTPVSITDTVKKSFTVDYTNIKDTLIVLPHPNTKDSLKVVSIVNGVLTITSILSSDKPLLNNFLNSETLVGGIVALILGIWRRIELRRLRRKGKLVG